MGVVNVGNGCCRVFAVSSLRQPHAIGGRSAGRRSCSHWGLCGGLLLWCVLFLAAVAGAGSTRRPGAIVDLAHAAEIPSSAVRRFR